MIPFRKSIGFRLLGISFILLALPLLVDSFILIQKRYEHAIGDAKGYLVETAHLREIPLSQLQPFGRPLIEVLIHYLKLESAFPEEITPSLNEELKKIAEVGEFYGVFIVKIDSEGRYTVVASNQSTFLGRDLTNFFKLYSVTNPSSLEQGYASYISFDQKTLEPFFIIAQPIYSLKKGEMVGVLAVFDDLTVKIKDLLVPEKRRYQVNFALLLPSMIVFAASDSSLKFQYFLPLESQFKALFFAEEPQAAHHLPSSPLKVRSDSGYPFFEFEWQGETQIGYIKQLPGAHYALLSYASKKSIFQSPLLSFYNIYSIYALILLAGGALALLITKRMARPIQKLSGVMQKIQQGSLKARYKKDLFGFEINELGEIFNQMVDAVLHQKHEAEEARVTRETVAKELLLGQQVQRNLLPRTMPHYPGVDIAETYIPAIEVGGDFYDVFIKGEGEASELVLAIADASGKGVQACFYSLSVRNMLRIYTKNSEDIAQAMHATNNLLRKDTGDSGMFVTVLAGIYNHSSRTLNYDSCGHNPGLIKKVDGEIEGLKSGGVAIGVLPYECPPPHSVHLAAGDYVIFYTDGVTEAHNEAFEFYGEERLIDCLRLSKFSTARECVESIVTSVNTFVGGAPQYDDITLLVMRITST